VYEAVIPQEYAAHPRHHHHLELYRLDFLKKKPELVNLWVLISSLLHLKITDTRPCETTSKLDWPQTLREGID
jgi:hypothetical protein